MDDFISKPIDIDNLFRKLNKWIKSGVITSVSKSYTGKEYADSGDSDMPHVDGIDIKSGLRRMLGDSELYINLLVMFHDGNTATASVIREAVVNRNNEKALRHIHSIKGSAGNISAMELHYAAEHLERAIINFEPGIENILSVFEAALERVLKSTAPLAALNGGEQAGGV